MRNRETESDHGSVKISIKAIVIFVLSFTTEKPLCINDDLGVLIVTWPFEIFLNFSYSHIYSMSAFCGRGCKFTLEAIV